MEKNARGVLITGFEYTYDILGRVSTEKHLDKNIQMCYTYDERSRVTQRTKVNYNTGETTDETFTYDAAGNIITTADNCDTDSFSYDKNNHLTYHNGMSVTYDADGNMTSAYHDGSRDSFRYDSTNRLIGTNTNAYTYNAENVRIRNLCGEHETTYVYNTNAKLSSMLMKTTDGVVTKYVYGRGLIGEETNGVFKTYHFDYRGHTLEWSRIRLLTKWDDTEIEYNASGIRTRKGNTYYELDGSTIISETTHGSTIRYYYGNGGIVGFRYNGNRYYYEKNLMGDIIGIYDENGSKVAGYIYDAWGNCTVQTYGSDARIGEVNPFRYRGYYFDDDLGLYYLKSRYYDAKVGRFINADSLNYLGANRDLGSYNLFAYCSDSPIAYRDSTGHSALGALFLSALAFAVGLMASGCVNIESDLPKSFQAYASINEEVSYDTYDDALNAGNELVLNAGRGYDEYSFDREGDVIEYGVEYNVDIYYNTETELFYLTNSYTMYDVNRVDHLDLLKNDGTYVMMGFTHYHPAKGDGADAFSPETVDVFGNISGDIGVAKELKVAAHLITYDGKVNNNYDYISGDKKKIIGK